MLEIEITQTRTFTVYVGQSDLETLAEAEGVAVPAYNPETDIAGDGDTLAGYFDRLTNTAHVDGNLDDVYTALCLNVAPDSEEYDLEGWNEVD